MVKNIITVLMISAFAVASYGQDSQKMTAKERKTKDLQENVDSLQLLVDSLRNVISMNDSIKAVTLSVVEDLKEAIKTDSVRVGTVLDSLQTEIAERDAEIMDFQQYAGFLDTCMVKLANRWLFEKFDKEAVDEAISYFDWMYSSQMKSDLSIVQRLLKDYEKSYKEFQSILKEAQSDIERESPFAVDGYKKRYLDRLAGMGYYKQYYNSDWSIRYLDKQISDAIEILENHSDIKPADFTSLIDPNI